jgi:DNA-binding response OmpR family regulator
MPRVLVVDDDPSACAAVEVYLARHDRACARRAADRDPDLSAEALFDLRSSSNTTRVNVSKGSSRSDFGTMHLMQA